MTGDLRALATAAALFITVSVAETASAQKSGGILKIYHRDSPASMSILEEATNSTEIPMMGVFNNLVLYKQDVAQNSLQFDHPGSGHRLVVERGRQRTYLPPAPRRQVARRPPLHCQ